MPSTIRDWLGVLDAASYSQIYRTAVYLDSAVQDRRIAENPCKARTIERPTSSPSSFQRVRAAIDGVFPLMA